MHPALIKAREIRIAQDGQKLKEEAEKRRQLTEFYARKQLAFQALGQAFTRVRVRAGRLRITEDKYNEKYICIDAYPGTKFQFSVRIFVEPEPDDEICYRVDGFRTGLVSVNNLLDRVAEVIAPELDLKALEDSHDRVYRLDDREREMVARALEYAVGLVKAGELEGSPLGDLTASEAAELVARFRD